MAESFSEFIEKLLARTNIVHVVSRYIPLKKKGNRWWGCCPFHHEKEPSFTVSEDKQFYYCFGCQETGNAITFVEKMESIERIDAIKRLAEEAKMEMPEFKGTREKEVVSREKRERLYSLMKETARHYHENLSKPGAKNATDYIKTRGIPDNLVTRFGLGVSLNGSEIISHLESKGYTKAEMKEVGLIEQRADSYYDVFYGRFMVPIIDNFGQVVAFGGRIITPETHIQQKYRNSTNTIIFDKSKTLYGINLLKKKKQREKINSVIIVEGYMDVIALHKAGFDTAVASMGTALTLAQAKAIKNYSNLVYVSYDGDGAGQKATLRGLDILRSVGLTVKVVSLPDELDPDDLIKRDGPQAYQKALDEAVGLIEYKLNLIKKEYEKSTSDGKFDPETKAKFATESLKVIASLDNPIEREEYLKMVHADTGYPMEVLRGAVENSTSESGTFTPPVAEKRTEKVSRTKDETFLLACLINGKSFVKVTDDVIPLLSSENDRLIAKYSLDKIENGEKPVIGALMETFDADLVREIAEFNFNSASEQSIEQSYRDYLKRLKIKVLEDEKASLTEQFTTTKDVKLLGQISQIGAKIRALVNGDSEEE